MEVEIARQTFKLAELEKQNAELLEALKQAQVYIIEHCHQLIPPERQGKHIPKLIREAIEKVKEAA